MRSSLDTEKESPKPVGPAASSGEHALERGATRRLAMRGQHELDRQVEQRAEPADDVFARHVLATAELDVQSVAEVGERVAGDDRFDGRQPGDEIVVLASGVRLDAERPGSGAVELSFAFSRAQPGARILGQRGLQRREGVCCEAGRTANPPDRESPLVST
jgi:hypothetical protein